MYKDMQTTTPKSGAADNRASQDAHPIDDELNIHDASFRRHYQLHYANEPLEYESFFAPAYRYGFELSGENPDADWEDVEDQAHTDWVANHPVSWETAADAIEYGWREERNPSEHRADRR